MKLHLNLPPGLRDTIDYNLLVSPINISSNRCRFLRFRIIKLFVNVTLQYSKILHIFIKQLLGYGNVFAHSLQYFSK